MKFLYFYRLYILEIGVQLEHKETSWNSEPKNKKKAKQKSEEAAEDPGSQFATPPKFRRSAKFCRVVNSQRPANFYTTNLLRSQFLTFCPLCLFSSQIIPL